MTTNQLVRRINEHVICGKPATGRPERRINASSGPAFARDSFR